jgi:hypothetical protein
MIHIYISSGGKHLSFMSDNVTNSDLSYIISTKSLGTIVFVFYSKSKF